MSDAIIFDGVLQSFGDVRLSDEIFESLRAPLARNNLVGRHT